MGGFVLLFKKFEDWEWYTDSSTKDVFIHILINANYKTMTQNGMTVKKGQCITSLRKIASKLDMSVNTVRRALDNLVSTKEIKIENTPRYSIITVSKYDYYQGTVSNFDTVTDTLTDTVSTSVSNFDTVDAEMTDSVSTTVSNFDTVDDKMTDSVSTSVSVSVSNFDTQYKQENNNKKEINKERNNQPSIHTHTYTREQFDLDEELTILREIYNDESWISDCSQLMMIPESDIRQRLTDFANELKTDGGDDSKNRRDLIKHLKSFLRLGKRINETKKNDRTSKRRGFGVTATRPEEYEGPF